MTQRKEQEVWQACDDLLAMGKMPREITGEAIGNRLRELGLKPGSLTYRYRYRDSWMEERGLSRETTTSTPRVEATDIIDRSAAIFRQSIEASIRDGYEKRCAAIQTELDTVQAAYDLERQTGVTLLEDKERLTAWGTAIQSELAAAQSLAMTHHQSCIQLEERLQVLAVQFETRKLEWMQQLEATQNTAKAQIETLAATVQEHQKQHHLAIDTLRQEAEAQRHQWIVQQDALKVEKDKITRALEKSTLAEKQLQEELHRLGSMLTKQAEAHERQATAYAEKESQCHLLREEIAALQGKNTGLMVCVQTLTEEREQRQSQQQAAEAVLTSQLEQLQQTVAALLQCTQTLELIKGLPA